jgi:hypothetical protein
LNFHPQNDVSELQVLPVQSQFADNFSCHHYYNSGVPNYLTEVVEKYLLVLLSLLFLVTGQLIRLELTVASTPIKPL